MNGLKLIPLLALFFSFFNFSIAQIVISGKITDPNLLPVENALVEIFDQNDTLNVYSTTTDSSGYFLISNITDIQNSQNTFPNNYLLIRNYPNPFNPSTIIYFELPESENIKIKIFDILGREVRTLYNGFHKAGVDQIYWDGKGNFNQPVSAGIYLCQLKTKSHLKVHKMVLLDGGTSSAGNIRYNKISKQSRSKLKKINAQFNFTVKVTADSVNANYFRNLVCSGDTTLNLIVDKIFLKETIGIAGGTIEKNEFRLSIPTEALDQNYDITISKTEGNGAFSESKISNFYKIDGLPDNYTKPLKIQFEIDQQYTGVNSISIGQLRSDELENTESYIYQISDAIDSLNFLIGYLPTSDNGFNNGLNKLNFYGHPISFIVGPLLQDEKLETEHFKISLPYSISENITTIGDVLEDCYKKAVETFPSPFRLEIEKYEVCASIQDKAVIRESNIINLKRSYVFNKEFNKLRTNIGKELTFNGLSNIIVDQKILNNSQISLDEEYYTVIHSIIKWSEELFTTDQDFKYPDEFIAGYLAPFNGLRAGAGNNLDPEIIKKHSSGISSIIKYLVDDEIFGYEGIVKTCIDIGNGTNAISSLINNVNGTIGEWYPEYYKKYLLRELYIIPSTYFSNYAHYEWNINSKNDTLSKFLAEETDYYPDISARLFRINLNYPEIDATQNMLFKMDAPNSLNGLSLVVFGVKDQNIIFLGTANSQDFLIPNLRAYYEDDIQQFLVALVNSNITQSDYLGKTAVDLEISISPKEDLPDCTFDPTLYDQCNVGIMINADMYTEYTNGDTVSNTELLIQSSGIIDGSFSGNTFTGISDNGYRKDTLVVTLNEGLNMVESVYWVGFEENTDWNIYWDQGFSASNVILNCNFPFKFDLTGESVKNKITGIKYEYTTSTYIKTLTDFSSNDQSSITIEFSKK